MRKLPKESHVYMCLFSLSFLNQINLFFFPFKISSLPRWLDARHQVYHPAPLAAILNTLIYICNWYIGSLGSAKTSESCVQHGSVLTMAHTFPTCTGHFKPLLDFKQPKFSCLIHMIFLNESKDHMSDSQGPYLLKQT